MNTNNPFSFKTVHSIVNEFKELRHLELSNLTLSEYKGSNTKSLNHQNYALISFQGNIVPDELSLLIYHLQLNRFIPIFVAPEQNDFFISNPSKLFRYIEKGAVIQINSSSVLRTSDKNISRFTHLLISRNLVHLIAIDPNEQSYHYVYSEIKKITAI